MKSAKVTLQSIQHIDQFELEAGLSQASHLSFQLGYIRPVVTQFCQPMKLAFHLDAVLVDVD